MNTNKRKTTKRVLVKKRATKNKPSMKSIHLIGCDSPSLSPGTLGTFIAFLARVVDGDKHTLTVSYFHPCRELIGGHIDGLIKQKCGCPAAFGVALGAQCNYDNMVKFLDIVQDMLGLAKEDRLEFVVSATHKNVIVCPDIGKFWGGNQLRREFMSMFIRCGLCFFKGDLTESLLSYNLTKEILPVIDWFLSGNTVQRPAYQIFGSSNWNGICRLMYGRNSAQFGDILCKP